MTAVRNSWRVDLLSYTGRSIILKQVWAIGYGWLNLDRPLIVNLKIQTEYEDLSNSGELTLTLNPGRLAVLQILLRGLSSYLSQIVEAVHVVHQ